MLSTTVLAALVATVAAAKDSRTFAVLHHYGNGPLTTCRADPIINPGVPSSHVHTVMGASNFGLNATGETLRQSSCTTAKIKADLSAYWFPTLYFQDPETKLLEQVKMFYMNVYYFFDATNDDIKSFPVGLQMLSGNAQLRTAPSTSGANQLDPSKGPIQPAQITCPRGNFNPPSWPAGSDGSKAGIQDPNNLGSGIGFPFQDCDGYASPLRVDLHFPSCYNPAAGLTNYKTNMQFPSDAGSGKLDCPKGWIHVPHIFYETYWDTHALLPRFQNLIGKSSPFVFANGDTTGFSAHGDFISGWDEDELQHIIDTCDVGHAGLDQCPGIKLGVNDGSGSCNIKCPVDEVIDGKLTKLPGNNPLAGWGYGGGNVAAPAASSAAPSSAASSPAASSPSPSAQAQPAAGGDDGYGGGSGSGSSSSVQAAEVQPSSSSVAPPPPSSSTTLIPVTKAAVDPTTSKAPSGPKTTTVFDTVTVWATKTVYEDGSNIKPAAATQLPQAGGKKTAGTPDIAGFQYVGCYKDASTRTLAGETLPALGRVSNTNCVTYCASKGFSLAGTEYGGECFCGNSIAPLEKIDDSKCAKPCEGDATQTCGGDWALTLYSKGGKAPAAVAKRHAGNHLLQHKRVAATRHHRR